MTKINRILPAIRRAKYAAKAAIFLHARSFIKRYDDMYVRSLKFWHMDYIRKMFISRTATKTRLCDKIGVWLYQRSYAHHAICLLLSQETWVTDMPKECLPYVGGFKVQRSEKVAIIAPAIKSKKWKVRRICVRGNAKKEKKNFLWQ